MGIDDKLSNSTKETKGDLKQSLGDATGDRDMQAEGKKDKAKGALGNAKEKVKDALPT